MGRARADGYWVLRVPDAQYGGVMLADASYDASERILVLRVPGRPGYKRTVYGQWMAVLSGNSRSHHMEKHRIKQRDDEAVYLLTLALMPRCPMFTSPLVRFDLHMTGAMRRDFDNQVGLIKGALDGLTRGGIIADDSMDVIGKPEVNIIREQADNFCVITVAERAAGV